MDVSMDFLKLGGALIGAMGVGYLAFKTLIPAWLRLDLQYLRTILPAMMKYGMTLRREEFLIDYLERRARETPDKTLLIFEDKKYTYKEMDDKASHFARLFSQKLGLKKKDVVCLMMYNSPEFLWICFGLAKLGVAVSLINYNLRHKALLHSLTVSETGILFVGQDTALQDAIKDVYADINMTVYVLDDKSKHVSEQFKRLSDLDDKIDDSQKIEKSLRAGLTMKDPSLYIFTSGTTGLPKPAIVSLQRMSIALALSGMAGINQNDVLYVSLPLYHSLAMVLGVTGGIMQGSTIVLARSFSKSRFFSDCKKHNVTVMFYIGELCRYLLTNPPRDDDGEHNIRMAMGNGLRKDIFTEFKQRYNIPKIVEFYASTEGSMGFANILNVDGSIGRLSPFLRKFAVGGLYKWDVEKESLVRDENGLCIEVPNGEPGLLLCGINDKKQPFDGYKGKREHTESKLVRDVQKKGDVYYNSGDLLRMDSMYNLYFSDRVGDTFRWKGENVSTVEVSNSLTEVDFVIDACVYGVTIPGYDGRAGMATLLVSAEFGDVEYDVMKIAEHCQSELPVYAMPMFLRIEVGSLDMTSTIKQSKVRLKAEGYDIDRVNDKMYYFDKQEKQYKELTKDAYNAIMNKDIEF